VNPYLEQPTIPPGMTIPRVATLTREATARLAPEGERSPRIPYDRITNALLTAARAFPTAVSLRPIWTPTSDREVLVEVWERSANGHLAARTVGVEA
jgi:hypothetical protein